MLVITKDLTIQESDFHWVLDAQELPTAFTAAKTLISLAIWQEHKKDLSVLHNLSLILNSDELVEDIEHDLTHFQLIALNFSTFNDGRHFSNARLLRERFKYSGEIRALGDVTPDLMPYMLRCGIDSFQLKEGSKPELALEKAREHYISYQAAFDEKLPLYRRRAVA
ncbi:DUF934 domain-containing protein [Pseudomonas sp. F1_0610]|uniref:DUF934 domain-containing protein n=1 Tax=Pseudomonas sp. F1_0610 TaxID=3114284 RepID=UPI0039C00931